MKLAGCGSFVGEGAERTLTYDRIERFTFERQPFGIPLFEFDPILKTLSFGRFVGSPDVVGAVIDADDLTSEPLGEV